MIKVIFICVGNICRSPMAKFIFKQMVAKKGLTDQFEIDSAATENFNEIAHEPIDYRAADMLTKMNVPFTQHYSHQLRANDYQRFDYILAMDEGNVQGIREIVGKDPENKIHRLLEYTKNPHDIKDPWYTGNFDEAYWDIYEGCHAFLEYIQKQRR